MQEEIIIPDKMSTFEDKKTKAKTVAFPIVFPKGKNGALMITKLEKNGWNPSEDIKSIIINYNEN